MLQIAKWLDELGLSEHTERFIDNRIDVAVLPLLTDEDLKEIGIPLWHRRKILAAITVTVTNILCGNYAAATALADELVALAEEKSTVLFKAWGIIHGGCVSALNGEAAEAIRIIPSGLSASRLTGARYLMPLFLSNLAWAYAELGRCDEGFALH